MSRGAAEPDPPPHEELTSEGSGLAVWDWPEVQGKHKTESVRGGQKNYTDLQFSRTGTRWF